MATTTRVPLEIYLRSSYEPDAEYVDGEIEERPAAEYDHSSWQHAIELWFAQHAKEWKIRVRPELRVQVASERFRVPDVTVLDRNQPIEQIITHAPVAVFEILSPEDTHVRLMRKLEDYAAMGIPQIWVVDPRADIKSGSFRRYVNDQLVRSSEFDESSKGIHFSLHELEALLD
jgi:Uma2 family endonuclease